MPESHDLEPAGGQRQRRLLVVMLATSVSSNVGFAFGVLGPQLRSDLGVSRTALGVLASAFFAATGAASMAAGRLVRRIGARRSAGYALGIECVVCIVAGLAGSYLPLQAAALLAGVSYAVVNVASNRVVRSLADDAHLGRYMTVKTAGVPVATTTIAVVSGLTTRWGWQPVVVGIGVCAGLAAIAAVRTLGQLDPPNGAARPAPADLTPASPTPADAGTIHLGSDRLGPGFFLLPLAGFCFIAGSQPLYNWVPSYLHESLGLTVRRASLATGLATAIGIPAMIGIARLADRVGGSYRALFLGGLCAITGTATVLVLLAAVVGVGTAVVGLVVGVSANLALAGLFPALIVEHAPHAIERGTGVAMTGYFFGALASPVGFGALADRSGGYTLPWLVCLALLATGTVLCVLIQVVRRPAVDEEPVSLPVWDG